LQEAFGSRSGLVGRGTLNDRPMGEGAEDAECGAEQNKKQNEPAQARNQRLGASATAAGHSGLEELASPQPTRSEAGLQTICSIRTPKLESPDRLEHRPLNTSRSLGGMKEGAGAADRKALSNLAFEPIRHLELRNSGSSRIGKVNPGGRVKWHFGGSVVITFERKPW
jgi:hypothetical protein